MKRAKIIYASLFFVTTVGLAKTISITNSGQFEQEVTNSNQPAVVKFYTEWCGPCKMSKAPFSEVSDQSEFKHIKFVEIDADKNAALMSKFNIDGFPTFIFMEGPSIKQKTPGALGAFDPEDFKLKLEHTLRQLFPSETQKQTVEEKSPTSDQQKTEADTTTSNWFNSIMTGIKNFFTSLGNTISGWFS